MTNEVGRELEPYLKAVAERKAQEIVVLKVSDLTPFADFFIICSGRSSRQVNAISDFVQVELKKIGTRPLSFEGKTEGHWVLMDYGHVIIHIFYEPTRKFYDLEGLWSDAGRVEINNILGEAKNE